MENGQLDSAKVDLDRALKLNSNLPGVYQERGLFYQNMKDYRNAGKSFSMAIKLDSLYHPARLNLSVNHMHLMQFDSALMYLDCLERLDTSNVLVHINKGVVYEQKEEFTSALEQYTLAIEKSPLDFKGYQYRGVVLFRIGKYSEALVDVENWIRLKPRNGKAYLWRSRIKFLQSDFGRAKTDALKSISLGAKLDDAFLKLINDSLIATY